MRRVRKEKFEQITEAGWKEKVTGRRQDQEKGGTKKDGKPAEKGRNALEKP